MTQAHPEVRETARPQIDPDLKKVMDAARGVLVANGLSDLANRAWAQVTRPASAPAVVVVGEVKRGKSSLVNVLLARPNASPVDVDITTSAFVRFVPPSESMPEGAATLLFAGGRREPVDFADLPSWVTMSGQHVNDPTVDELPIGAEVAMVSPFLPSVTLVDTPGVGGLNPNHLRLTRTATTTASILVMTCDATAPITAPELKFLESVSAEVNSVLIAVTKIDKNFRHWQTIVEENRRLLRQHGPRFAEVPILGVSSTAAFSAIKMEPGDRRKSALRASGLSALVQQLHRICASSDTLAAANGLRAARTGLERVANQLAMQRSAMIRGQSAAAELNEEKKRLQTLRQEWEGGWRDYLARDLGAIQRNTLTSLDHKLDDLRSRWRTKLDSTKLDILRRSPQLFVADMTADLEVLVGEVSDEYVSGVNQLVGGLQINADVSVKGFTSEVREIEPPRKRGEGVIDPSMMSTAITGFSTMGMGLVSALAIGSVVAVPLVAAIGGAWIAVNFGFRAIKMGRQGLQQWLNMTATAVAKDVSREIQERGDAIRPVIINAYKQYLTDSMTELKNLIAAAETAEKSSRAERADAVAELDTKRKSLQAIIAGADAQLARLAAANSGVQR
ncbi:MAG TPA: dynamin family protein [Mycobacterium sp.]|uniref:dynamin family protein n=1 Tax=Mycobacterium sp. TaxID=1785 RepID=UPI002CCC3615|nr:dynamin family protein [Mycobacterium sp.]HME77197.1 dynamin family protein [Mycobacterium sp.]